MNKRFLSLGFILAAALSFELAAETLKPCTVNADCSQSKNFFPFRAFSSYSTRAILAEKPVFQVDSNRDQWLGSFSAVTEYMQNWGQKCNSCKNLGAYPFWSGTNTMTVGNNQPINGVSADLDAYQFGLGDLTIEANTETENPIYGTISLNPRVQHVGTDFTLYFAHATNERGFFFKLNAPLGAMIVNPRLKEEGINPDGDAEFSVDVDGTPTDYTWSQLNTDDVLTTSYYPGPTRRYSTLSQAFFGGNGCCGKTLDGSNSKPIGLLYGRIASGRQSVIKFADVSASFGYNVWANDKGLIGVAFKGTCPTGNAPTAKYMLEPVFGRAGAWGVGGELMAHYRAWENEAGTRYLDMWLQGEVLHLIPGRTPNMRSFDLKQNGPGSKYLLLQQYLVDSTDTEAAGPVTQAINVTTLPVISKIQVEGSVALMLDFHCHNWNVAVAGEFWGRSKESLSIDMCSATDLTNQDLNNFAVVGRQVSNYNFGATQTVATLCQPLATISTSEIVAGLVTGTPPTLLDPLPENIADAKQSANRIPSNVNDALNIDGAAASKAFTGKVTGSIGYTFNDNRYAPSISLFGGAEFTPRKSNNAIQYWSAGCQMSLNF